MEIQENVHWKKIGLPRHENGRDIYKFQCLICGKIFKRHRNANAHCKLCLYLKQQIPDQRTINDFFNVPAALNEAPVAEPQLIPNLDITDAKTIALIELISEMNIPHTQLSSPA